MGTGRTCLMKLPLRFDARHAWNHVAGRVVVQKVGPRRIGRTSQLLTDRSSKTAQRDCRVSHASIWTGIGKRVPASGAAKDLGTSTMRVQELGNTPYDSDYACRWAVRAPICEGRIGGNRTCQRRPVLAILAAGRLRRRRRRRRNRDISYTAAYCVEEGRRRGSPCSRVGGAGGRVTGVHLGTM